MVLSYRLAVTPGPSYLNLLSIHPCPYIITTHYFRIIFHLYSNSNILIILDYFGTTPILLDPVDPQDLLAKGRGKIDQVRQTIGEQETVRTAIPLVQLPGSKY